MSSGVWLPAEQVAEMSSMAMREMVTDWQREREFILSEATQTKWSWRRFRYVRAKMPRKEAERTTDIGILDYWTTSPVRNKPYAALNDLCITAINAEQLVPKSQIFVSVKDFSHIAPFIDGKERYDSVHDGVDHSGDTSD